MFKYTLFSAAFVAASTSASVAGPDDTTRHFMNEPLSLLDWGVYRIGELLDGKGTNPAGWARYDFESNTIIVMRVERVASSDASTDELSEMCKRWMASVRARALVSLESGEAFGEDYSQFAAQFTHEGYNVGEQEENTKRLVDLDKKMRLNYTVMDNGFRTLFECNAPLLGTGFSVQDMRP